MCRDRNLRRYRVFLPSLFRRLSEVYLQIFDLSVSQWKILPIIGYYGPMSAKEVGKRTSLEPEKVTRAVDQFVVRGLVTRKSDSEDRRRCGALARHQGTEVFEESEKLRGLIETSSSTR